MQQPTAYSNHLKLLQIQFVIQLILIQGDLDCMAAAIRLCICFHYGTTLGSSSNFEDAALA
jgi:hypothetical protein